MSTETIFRQLGRINESHTGIGPGKTREEYLRLFSRSSYSSENDWPSPSPLAGFYDVKNSTTSLILLNQRFKFSHLRGKVAPRAKSRSSSKKEDDQKTFFEKIVEFEQQATNENRRPKSALSRVTIDPYRHFESIFDGQTKYWHDRMCKGSHSFDDGTDHSSIDPTMPLGSRRRPRTASSFQHRRHRNGSPSSPNQPRAKSALGMNDKWNEELKADPGFTQSLREYYRFMKENMHKPPKVGLQRTHMPEPPNRRLRHSGIYRNPALSEGQKLYLLQKCHIYDIQNAKRRHTNSYLQVLNTRFKADLPACKLDFAYKPEYRLHDPYEFVTYAKFVKAPRPTARALNTGYFTSKKPHQPRIPGDHKQQLPQSHRSSNHLDKQDFLVATNDSFSRNISRPRSARRISADSVPADDFERLTIQFRPNPKSAPKVSVSSVKHNS